VRLRFQAVRWLLALVVVSAGCMRAGAIRYLPQQGKYEREVKSEDGRTVRRNVEILRAGNAYVIVEDNLWFSLLLTEWGQALKDVCVPGWVAALQSALKSLNTRIERSTEMAPSC
jgi:hypothetical protein